MRSSRGIYIRARLSTGVAVLLLAITAFATLTHPAATNAATSDTVNFQAKLMKSNGAVAPDGYYNVEFKLYDASTGGTALWTETWYDSNGVTAGNDNRIRVANGYLTVNLGAQNAFPAINWAQNLYITMNVGGTTQTASPTYDGEMNPRLKLTAVPYAFSAGSLSNLNGGFTSTLVFQGASGQNQTIQIPDNPLNATDDVCLLSLGNCAGSGGGITGSGTQNYVARFDSSGSHIGNSFIFDNGTFLGINTSTNSGSLVNIQGSSATANTIFTTAAASASVATSVIQQSSGQTGPLIEFRDSAGNVNSSINAAGNILSLGRVAGSGTVSQGKIVFGDGTTDNYSLTLQSGVLSGNTVVSIPATGSTDTVCLYNLGNCVGAGGGITGSGTQNYLTKFNNGGGTTIGDSSLYDDGSFLGLNTTSNNGLMSIQGATTGQSSLFVQAAASATAPSIAVKQATSQAGDLLQFVDTSGNPLGGFAANGSFYYANSGFTTTLSTATLTANQLISLPNETGTVCLQNSANCGFVTGANTDFIQNQTASTQTAGFKINGNGTLASLTATTSVLTSLLDTASAGTLSIGTTNATSIGLNQDVNIAANKSIAFASGTGNFDMHLSSGTFQTGTGNVSINGAATASAGITLTNGGSLATQKGTDFSTTGSSNDVNFGSASLYRLTGASTQTITGIAGGVDGRLLTLINAASQAAVLRDESTSSSAANRIVTGTSADINIGAGASITLIYDSGASRWRINGQAAGNSTGVTTVGAISGTSDANGATITGTVLNLTAADGTNGGVVTNTTQTFAGLKTFQGGITSTNINTTAAQATNLGNATGGLTITGDSSSTFVINGSTIDAVEFALLDGKDAPLIDTNDAVNTAITGTGALTSGSIGSGFGVISTANNITTSANISTTGTGTITSAGLLTASGGLTATNINTTAAQATNLGNSTGTLTITGDSATTFVINGVTVDASEFNLLDGRDAALVDVNDAVATAITGTGTLTAGSINWIGAITTTGNISTTGSGTITSAGIITANGGVLVANTGALATQQGTDFATTGSSDDVNFGAAGLYRLTGASAQTITGIAGGSDGRQLTLVNAASQAATLANNSGSSTASNRIITGTGSDITIPAGGSISLIYDASANFWRVNGSAATTLAPGVNTIGTFSSSNHYSDGAQISGTTLTLGAADASNPGLVDTGAQTFAGLKTFQGGITAANINTTAAQATSLGNSTGALTITGNASSTFVINGSTIDATEFALLDGKDAPLIDTNDAVNTAITGTGALTSGSIGSGFGVISTANNITTSANISTTGTGTITSAGLLTANGGLTASNINTTAAQSTNLGNGTGTFTVTGDSSSTFVVNGVTVDASEFNLLDTKDAPLVDTNDAVATAITGTGALTAGSINWGGAIATSGNISTSGTGTITSAGIITANGGILVASSGSIATAKGTDFATTGSSDDVIFGAAGLYRLTGASAQTITGIAGGSDGRQLTLVNAASQAATISNNSTSSLAANRIITGTGSDITVPAGGSITLIYDAGANFWRVNGSAASTLAPGVNTVGAISGTSNANGATITGTTLNLTAADGTNGGVVTTSAQTFAGLKTFQGGITSANINTTAGQATALGNATGALTITGNSSSTFVINGSTVDATEFTLLDGKDAALVDINDAVNTAITGTGALTSGSIGSGFGVISTANNITTSANISTTGTGTITSAGLLTASGGLTATNINTTAAQATNLGNSTGAFTVTGNSSSTFVVNGVTIDASEFNLLDTKDAALVDVNDAVATAITGTGALTAGSINWSGAITTTGNISTTGSGTITSAGIITANGGVLVANTGAIATAKGTDFSTTGSSNDVNFGAAGLYRLTGASAQTITGIAGGSDGRQLTLVNAASQAATLSNNSGSSTATNRIITGTGSDVTIPAGGSITLVYDSTAGFWRVNGSAASTLAPGVNTVGAISGTSNANGATITGTTINLAAADGTNGGVLTNAAQTIAGLKTFQAGITSANINTTSGQATSLGNSTGALTITGNSSSTFVINGSTVDATEFTLLDGKDAPLIDTNDAVNTAITGTGALTSGSIGSGFGVISTANNITTSANISTTGTGTITSAGLLTASGGLTATNINTTAAQATNLGNGTGALALIGNSSSSFVLNGVTVSATEFNLLDGRDTALVDTTDAVNTAITGTGVLGTGSINWSGNIATTGNISTSGTGTITSAGIITANAGINIANTGSLSTAAGTTFTTAGTSNNAALNVAGLYLLDTSGAAQVINGITAGRDGQQLTLTNTDAALAVTLSNNSGSATGSKIITGTGSDVSLPIGSSIQLIYDSTNSFWRVVGGTAASGGVGVNAIGAVSGTPTANGATITGTTLNLAVADGSNAGLVGTGAQTFGGAKTFSALITGNAGISTSGGAVSLQGNASSSLTTTTGTLNVDGPTVTIGTSTATAVNIGNSGANLTVTGNGSSSFVINGSTISAAEFILLDTKDAALVDVNDAVNTAITGTGALNTGSITSGFGSIDTGADNITTTGVVAGGTVTVATTGALDAGAAGAINIGKTSGGNGTSINLNQATTAVAGITLTNGGSLATQKGTDYSITGATNDVNFGSASLYRLTGASSQTITGIAGGFDGRILTLVNATANPATIANSNGSSSAANRISSGTGADVSLPAGASITMVYDSTSNLWRVTGSVASTLSAGVSSVGSISGTSNANGATITGTVLNLTAADATNGGVVTTSSQTFAGLKTFQGGITSANINTTAGQATALGNSTGALTITGNSSSTFVINGSTVDATEFTLLDGKDAPLIDANDAVNTAITGTGALTSGSIGSGFGVISTANNITTSANISTTGSGTITSAGLLTASGGLTATNINTTAAQATNIGNSTGTATYTGNSSSTFVLNGVTVTATEFNLLDGRDTALVDTTDAVNTAITGTGVLGSGSINWSGAISTTGNISTTGTGTITSAGVITANGGVTVANTGSLSTSAGSSFTTAGTSTNAALNVASFYTMNTSGAAQVIQGITAGRDGQRLTLSNINASAVTLANNNAGGTALGKIVTGTGSDVTIVQGASIELVYDATATVWRVVGGVSATGGVGVNTVGAVSGTPTANGATITGTTLNLAVADASNAGLVSTAAQTLGGAKTFSALITGNAGITTTGGAFSLQGNAASSLTTTSGSLTIDAAAALQLGNANATSIAIGRSGITTTVTGGFTQNTGVFSLQGNGASTITTTSGNTTVDSAATLNLGNTNATALALGHSGVTTTITGGLTQLTGAVSLTANAASTFTTTAGNLSFDSAAALNIAGTNATSVAIGRSGITTTITGGLTQTTGAISLTGNAASSISTTTGNFSLDAAATVNIGTTNATNVTVGRSGQTISLSGATTATANVSITGAGSFATAAGSSFTTAGTSTNAALNVAGFYTMNTSGAAQVIQGITAGRDGQHLTLTNINALAVTLANNNGSATGSKIITGSGADMSLATGASVELIYDTTASFWRVVGSVGGTSVTTVGAISGTSNANGATITGNTLNLTVADNTNGGVVSNTTQTFAGAKTFSALITGNAGITTSGGAVSLQGNAASSITTTSGNLTIDSAAALQLGNTNATSVAIGRSGITTTVTGGFTQNTGVFSLQGNGASTITTTSGNTTVDSAATLNLGNTNATALALGHSGVTTTITGGLTQLTGAVSLTGNAASSFTTTAGNLSFDSAAALNVAGTNATSVAIGRSGITTTITGGLTQLTGAISLTGNAASSISTTTGNFSLDAAATVNIGTTNATNVTIGRSGQTISLSGATTATANVSITGAGSFATAAGSSFTTAGTSTNAALNVAGFYTMNTSGAAQVIQGITAGRDGQHLTLTNINALPLTLANNNGAATGSKIITGSGADMSLATGASVQLIYDTTATVWRVVGSVGGTSVTNVGAISGTSNANGATITGNTLNLTVADNTNGGVVSNTTQTFAGAKTFSALITGNAGITTSGGAFSLQGNAASNLTTTSGALTIDSAAALQLGNTNATSIAIGRSGITTTVTGGFTQNTGVFSLQGNGASTITTTSGNTTVDSAATLNLGNTNATALALGHSGVTTTITGGLTQLTGAVSLTGNAASSFTTTAGNLSFDSAAALNVAGTNATSVAIGRSGITTTITGGLTQLTGAISLTGNAASSISTTTGNFSLDAAATVNVGTTNATNVTVGRSGQTISLSGATTATANVSITGAGSFATAAGSSFTTAGTSTNAALNVAGFYTMNTAGAAQVIQGITAGRDGQHLTLTNINASVVTLANNNGAATGSKIITGSGADMSLTTGASVELIYDTTATVWRVVGSVGGTSVTNVGAISGTSNANGATITGNTLNLTVADNTNGGVVSNTTQTFAGAKTFSAMITGNAGITTSGGAFSLQGNAASSLTTTSGNLTIDSAAALQLGGTNATSIAIGRSGITTTVTGGLTQNTGVFSLQGNGASTITTTSGNTTVDSAATLNLGNTNATALALGHSGVTTTITGGLTQTTGAVSLTGNAASSFTTTTGNLSFDAAAALNLGQTNASSVAIGRSGITTTITGGLTQLTGAISLTGNAASTISTTTGNFSLDAAATVNVGVTNATNVTIGRSGQTISLNGATTATANVSITNAGAFATQKGTDYSTVGSTNDVALGNAGLYRLTGASTQTITGIAGGVDGRYLTLVNAAAQAAIITNDDAASTTAADRIITGTNSSISIPAGATVSMVYDSGASRWRVTSAVAATGGVGVNTIGAISGTSNANGATITGTTLNLTVADNTNGGVVSNTTQTFAGAKTFSALITGNAGITTSGGAVSLQGNAASSITTTSGNLTIDSAAALQLGNTNATSVAIGRSGITTTVTGGFTQTTGVFSLQGNGASTITTTSGNTTVDSAATLNLGNTNATALALGHSGVTTTITGGLTQSTGAVSLTGNAASSFTTTAGNLSFDSAAALNVAGTNATSVAIGRSGITTTITGGLTQTTGAISLTGNAASSISTTTGNFSLDAAATVNVGVTNATNVTIGRSGQTISLSGATTATANVSITGAGSFATAAGTSFTTAGTSTNATLNVAGFYTMNTAGAAQVIQGITAGRDGQHLTLTNINASAVTLANNNGAATGSKIITGTGADMSLATGTSVQLIYDSTATVWRVVGSVGGTSVTTVGAISGTSNANGATITGNTLNLTVADNTNGGVVSNTTQTFAGAKTFAALITGSAGISTSGGAVTLQGNAASSLTTTSGNLTLDAAAALQLGNTTATSIALGHSGITTTLTGGFTQTTGVFSLQGNAASTITTTSGNTTIDSAATLNLGNTTATGLALGRSGITTTITGGLTQLTGAVSLTGNAASSFTTTAGNLSFDAAAAVNVAGTNATSVAIGRSGITTTITGGLTQLTGAISLTGNAASSISTTTGNFSLDAAATVNVGTTNATNVTVGRSGQTISLSGATTATANVSITGAGSFATAAGASFTTAGTSTNATLNVAGFYTMNTAGAAQVIQGITAGRDGQFLTLTNINALAVTLANNNGAATGSKIITGSGADMSLAQGASVQLIYDTTASVWRVVGSVGGTSVTTVGAISGTSNANGATITGNTLNLTVADNTNGGVVSNTTQTFAGAKTFAALITGSAGISTSGGAVTLQGNAASSLTTTAGNLTLDSAAALQLGNTNATSVAIGRSGITTTVTGAFTQNTGVFSLQGNAASTITTTAGNTTVDSAATLNLGNTNATALALGHSGVTTTITGGLTQLTGAVSLTGNAASSFTTTAGNLSFDSAAALNLAGTNATGVAIGRSGITTTITGGLTQLTGAISLTGNAASSISTTTGNFSLDAAATVNIGTTSATNVTVGRSGQTISLSGATTATANVSITNAGSFASAAGAVFTAAGTSTNAALNVAGFYTMNTAGAAQVIQGITAGRDGQALTLTNINASAVTLANNNGAATGSKIITGTGADVTIPNGASAQLIYDGTATVWRVIGAAAATGGAGVNAVGAISGTSNANGATITGTTLNLTVADNTNGGVVSNTTQTFAGAKTFAALITGNAGLTVSGGTNSLQGNTTIGTTAGNTVGIGNSTGTLTVTGDSGSTFVINGSTISAAEFILLDTKDAALVDVNDAVGTAIIGTGALNSGSITSGFGAIDTGADNISTAGTVAAGNITVTNTSATTSLSINTNTTPTTAAIVVNDTSGVATDKLIALQASGSTKFSVDAAGNVVIGSAAGTGGVTNNGSTVNTVYAMANLASGGWDGGGAAATVDKYTYISANQTTASQVLTVPAPTSNTVYGRVIYLTNIGSQTFTFSNTYLTASLKAGATATLIWSNIGGGNWTYAGSDAGGIFNQTTQQTGANFNIDGTGTAANFKVTPGTGLFDVASAGALNIGTSTATSILIGNTPNTFNTTVQANLIVGSGNAGSVTALQAKNSGGAIALNVDTTNTRVGIGTATPGRTFDIQVNDSQVAAQQIRLQQAGTGDVGIELKNPSTSYYVGIDTSNANRFTINSSLAATSSSSTNSGNQSTSGSDDSGNNNGISAVLTAATATGTVSSISVWVTTVDATNPHMQVAIYADSAGSPSSAGPIAHSGTQTLIANSWNTFSISASVTNGTNYWLAFNVDGAGTHYPQTAAGSAKYYLVPPTTNFGNWPASWSTSNTAAVVYGMYMTINTGSNTDNNGSSIFSLGGTGDLMLHNTTNSASAFVVQNAAGTNILNVDTTNSYVSTAGRLGIATNAPTADISFGYAASRTINILAPTATNTVGGALGLNAGASTGNATGGALNLQAGTGGTTGTGGLATLQGGSGGSTSGTGGGVNVTGGTAVGAFAGGTVTIAGGAAAATAGSNGGAVAINGAAGSTTGTGGNGGGVSLTGANAGGTGARTGGSVAITAGNNSATGTGAAGAITLQGGASNNSSNAGGAIGLTAGAGNSAQAGGAITLQGGTGGATGAGGVLTLKSGNSGATSGTAGAVTLDTGTSASGVSQLYIGNTNAGNINIGHGNIATNITGNVGIQNQSATTTLAVSTNTTPTTAVLVVNDTSGNSGDKLIALQASGTTKFSVDIAGNVVIGNAAGTGSFTNNGATVNTPITTISLGSSGAIGTQVSTVDIYTYIPISATAPSLSFSIPTPSANTTYGRMIYVTNVGTNTFGFSNTYLTATLKQGATASLIWSNVNGVGNWTYAGSDAGGIFNQTTQQTGANFNIDGTGTAAGFKVIAGTGSFDVATAGILNIGTTTATSIVMGSGTTTGIGIQSSGTTRIQSTTDNAAAFATSNSSGANVLSVDTTNTANGLNLATNGGAESGTTNWSTVGGTVTQTSVSGEYAAGTAGIKAAVTTNTTGLKYNLTLTSGTSYIVSFSFKSSNIAFNPVVAFSTNGTSSAAPCVYSGNDNTSSSTKFVKLSCVVTATSSASAYILILNDSFTRNIFVDNLSVVAQNSAGTQNTGVINIGGGASGQGLTLLKLDNYAGTPFTGANYSLAGAMYFDTTAGKMQCYDGSIWGACGAAPNTLVTITPEYAGAVLNGTGVGTLTSDFCANESGILTVGTLCATHDARNFYKWNSPQATSQTYSMYVTYKLPSTFKAFVNGSTTLTGLVDSTANADVKYTIFKKTGSAIASCSAVKSVITGVANSWWTTTPTTDPSTCSFSANDSIIFKIDIIAKSNANAYAENLNFQFSNQ